MPKDKWPLIPDLTGLTEYVKKSMDEEVSVAAGASGWGIKSEVNPNYEEFLETWRAQSPFIKRIIK